MSQKSWCHLKLCQIHNLQLLQLLVFVTESKLIGAFLLESKHPIYWEVNFVYILNNLPAANDTENINEVSRCQLLANGRAKLQPTVWSKIIMLICQGLINCFTILQKWSKWPSWYTPHQKWIKLKWSGHLDNSLTHCRNYILTVNNYPHKRMLRMCFFLFK